MRIEQFGKGRPIVNFIVGVHGDEPAPLKGADLLKSAIEGEKLAGSFRIITANEEALESSVRFIDCDLNRVFPGRSRGNHEERLAARLMKQLDSASFNVDLHGTAFAVPPYAVVARLEKPVFEAISASGISNCVYHNAPSLIKFAPNGFAFEVGKADTPAAGFEACRIMERILLHTQVLRGRKTPRPAAQRLFIIYDVISRRAIPRISGRIQDFRQISKGSVIGTGRDGSVIKARESFYPVWVNDATWIRMAKRISVCECRGK